MANAFYSLIQFSPDHGRQEALNIGSVVFCPDPHALDVRLTDGFGLYASGSYGYDIPLFEASKRAFRQRLLDVGERFRDSSDLASFRASGTNPISLSPPRAMVVRDFAADALGVFRSLVTGEVSERHDKVKVHRGPRVATSLKHAFRSRGISDLVDDDVNVVVPAFGTSLKVPFGYQNGRYNLVEPVDFSLQSVDAREQRMSWYAVGGRSIFEVPDSEHGKRQLIVVARMPEDLDAASRITSVLTDYNVRCLPFQDGCLDTLAQEIRLHGKVHRRPIQLS